MATELSFPLTCALGHPSLTLNGYEELSTHHSSAHEHIPISDYTAQLQNPSGRSFDGPAPPPRDVVQPNGRVGPKPLFIHSLYLV